MKSPEWFKERIGKEITAYKQYEIAPLGKLLIADDEHASYLHKTQIASAYEYMDCSDLPDKDLQLIGDGVLVGFNNTEKF